MTRGHWLAGSVAAVAGLAALWAAVIQPSPNSEVVAAIGAQRLIEPRLSGGFRYAPASRSRAAATNAISSSADLRIAVGRLEKRVSQRRTPDGLAALGVAYLLSGDPHRAVLMLEEATDRQDPPAGALSDLAAAYLVRSVGAQYAQDAARALMIAERAVRSEPSGPEGWFNRALALEAVSLGAAAREAWEAYRRVDSRSGWADEAEQRALALSAVDDGAPARELGDVSDAIQRSDAIAVDRAVADVPDLVRDAIEQQLLNVWPQAVRAGRYDEARAILDRIALPSRAISRQYGDAFYSDCVDAAAAALARNHAQTVELARAHAAYEAAVIDYNEDRVAESARHFAELIPVFESAHSPLAFSAKRYVAIGRYFATDYSTALGMIGHVIESEMVVRYPRLRGQAVRLSGLIHVIRGEFALGLTDYQTALSLFRSAGDLENETQMYSSLAEDYHFLGDATEAWKAWREALRRVDRVQERRVRHLILQGVATAALRDEMPEAALHFQEAALDNARRWRRPPAVLLGYLNRAEIFNRLGSAAKAIADLKEAEGYLASLNDPLLTSRNWARLSLARGETLYHERPAEAIEALTSALSYFERTGTSWRLAGTYLARGRAYQAAHDATRAEQDFVAGINVFERMRSSISSEALRSAYFEQPWDLFTEMIRLQLDRGESWRALQIAEQARARTLLDAVAGAPALAPGLPNDVTNAIPEGVTVLYFATLDDRLLIWSLSRRRMSFAQQAVRHADLARSIARYADPVAGRDPAMLATLYDQLIRPVESTLAAQNRLVIVPDGVLNAVPFAGLLRRETGRYLIEDHALAMSPSLSLFLRSATLPSTGAAPRALIIGNPRLDGGDALALPDAALEARDIAALYSSATLLLNESATKSRFMATVGSYDVVHFAGHAVSNSDYPALSRLLLARGGGDDGTLFAHEITHLPFNRTRLVVLAACQTSAGRVRRGEGVFSLARPFLAAGVPSVVASLWDVDDRATRKIFVRFHQALRQGETVSKALRAAQIAMLAGDAADRNPFNWASFAVIGDGQVSGESIHEPLSH